jgi:membrane protein implicated in regulation of membrane protease activity
MTSMTEPRARMLLRGSMLSAFVVSLVSLAFGLHWLTLKRELTFPFAAWCALTSLCIYLSARWLRRRQLPL